MLLSVSKHIIALTAAISTTGCVGMAGMLGASVQAYDGPARADSEIAILVKSTSELSGATTFVKAVDDVSYGDDVLRGWPSMVKVLPGNHKVDVKCYYGDRHAFPTMTVDLKAGVRYEVGCRDLGNGYAEATIKEL